MTSNACFRVVIGVASILLPGADILLGADCNGNGVADVDDLSAATSADCNGNGIPDECDTAILRFGERNQGTSVAEDPLAIESTDLDGDGDDDLAVLTGNSAVTVLRNRGNGAFERAGDYPGGAAAKSLATGDVDGDGSPDLITSSDTEVFVLKNLGGGTFAAPSSLVAAAGGAVTLADLSGDGLVDLVTASATGNQVSVHAGDGAGNFRAPVRSAVDEHPVSVAVGDLDVDGDLDLASANTTAGSVSVLLNQGGAAMAAAVHYPVGSLPSRELANGQLLQAGDLDGDGALELVVATSTSVAVLANDGAGGFAAPTHFLDRPVALTLADMDADGDLDVAYGTAASQVRAPPPHVGFLKISGVATVLASDGHGRLTAAASVNLEAGAQALTTGDLDGDGDLDLAVATLDPDGVSVLLNGEDRTFSMTSTLLRTHCRPHNVTLGDLDGDGDVDIAAPGGGDGTLEVFINQGDGTMTVRPCQPAGVLVNSIASGDFDGDGDIDLVLPSIGDSVAHIFFNDGDANFEETGRPRTGREPFYVTTADVEPDGDVDIITADVLGNGATVLLNDGAGTFDQRERVRSGTNPQGVVPADLDGDGDLDLALSNLGAGATERLAVHRGVGDGTFAREGETYSVLGQPTFVAAGDLDGDGNVDLVTSQTNKTLALFFNRGDGTMEDAVDVQVEESAYTFIVVDMNGDGHLDLVTAAQGSDRVTVLLNDGTGAFGAGFGYAVGRTPRYVVAGDLDGDGDNDLVANNHGARSLTILLNRSPLPVHEDFLEVICTAADFRKLSIPSLSGGSTERVVRYTLPAREDPALLPAIFQNTGRYPLHQEFLQAVFPERFVALDGADYDRLVGRRATRDYFVGALFSLRTEEGATTYGFSVFANALANPAETLTLQEVSGIYETLHSSFLLEPLVYYPDTIEAREAAASWPDADFEILIEGTSGGPPEFDYVAYTRAVGYGRVRLLSQEAFDDANDSGQFGFQDVLVLERAPRDIDGVVAGVITAELQGELSHVSVRTARRGTPNAFVVGALEAFAPYEGKLVRLEVCDTDYSVREATLEEAEAFWAANRPVLTALPRLDADFTGLSSLAEIGAMDQIAPQEFRFGGKATNLARLAILLEGSRFEPLREFGFAIPIHYYLQFIRSNQMPSALDPTRDVTYEEHLTELLQSEDFRTDSQKRFAALESFRDFARDNGVVDQTFVDRIIERIGAIFPSTSTPVRFRSSSNVEDALEFNGAGLYESTGGCADDDLDSDDEGPSLCDPTKNNERDIRRALKKVWTSLYTFRAFEERSFFDIPENLVGMGILVSRAFPNELANGVAFTGNIANAQDKRFVVTVQLGEESVVSPDPGIFAEKDLLEIVGDRVEILRPRRGSSLVPPGTWILSDTHLEEIGRFLEFVDENFPIDLGDHDRDDVLLDLEFKLEPDDTLAFKQVRPFLTTGTELGALTFALEIPAGTIACGAFRSGRTAREEYLLKSRIELVSGRIELPTEAPSKMGESFATALIEEVLVGPNQERATSVGPGRFRLSTSTSCGGLSIYSFEYEEEFRLASGALLTVVFSDLAFQGEGAQPDESTLVIDDDFLTNSIRLTVDPLHVLPRLGAELSGGGMEDEFFIRYSSCSYPSLPLWQINAELDDGTTLVLQERFSDEFRLVDTVPASLVRAEVTLAGTPYVVSDYWNLVYSSARHNRSIHYWVELEPPAVVDGLEAPVRIVELVGEDVVTQAQASYLDANLEVLARRQVVSFSRSDSPRPSDPTFRRGDVNADRRVNIVDVLVLLDHIFRREAAPPCRKAADADDSGRLNIIDPLTILSFIFDRGEALAPPLRECGPDPSADGLDCVSFAPCT